MCGIVGFITKPLAPGAGEWERTRAALRGRWFKQALLFDTVRGEHSTGVMGRSEGNYVWYKNAVPGYEFVNDKEFLAEYIAQAATFDVMIGHNRAATVGDVNTDNAHPFEHGDVTLVHNGTLDDLGPMEFQQDNIEVDSSLIAYNLSMASPEDAGKVLSNLDGAYALVWMDQRDDSVNIVRNGRRPLHVATTHADDTLYLMSEGRMLDWTLDRLKINNRGIFGLAPHQWLKFRAGSMKPEVKEIAPFERPTPKYYTPHGGGRTTTMGWGRETTPSRTQTSSVSTPAPTKFEHDIPVGAAMERVPVPSVFQDIMSWFDLKVESRLLFEPEQWRAYAQDRHTPAKGLTLGEFTGIVYVPFLDDWVDCVVHTLGANLDRYCNQEWTVRPVTLTWDTRGQMTVHAMMVAVTIIDGVAMPEDEVEEPNTVLGPDGFADEEFSLDDEVFDGPYGDCSREQFEQYVKHGCSMCTGNISIEDASEVEWVGDTRDMPVCPVCVADWQEVYS